jgi:hypothetical protein
LFANKKVWFLAGTAVRIGNISRPKWMTMSQLHYAIFRVKRLNTQKDLRAATLHGQRADSGRHYDPKRTPYNCHWSACEATDAVDWQLGVEDAIERLGANRRKNGALAAEIFLSASSDYFLPVDALDLYFNTETVFRWARINVDLLYERFGKAVVAIRLDLDEGVPHLAACVIPVYDKVTKKGVTPTVSYRKVFGGETREAASKNLTAWQDWYAEKMAPLGLSRGVPKRLTGRTHLSHNEYARKKRREDNERMRALELAKEQAAQLEGALASAQMALTAAQEQMDDAEKLKALAFERTVAATKALADAENARKFMEKVANTLNQYDPQAEIAKAIAAKAPTIRKWDEDVSRIAEEVSALSKPEGPSGPK